MKTLFALPLRLLTLVVWAVMFAVLWTVSAVQGKQRHFGYRLGFKADEVATSTQGFMLEVALPVTTGTPTYIEVNGITDIPDPTGEASDLDATNLKSTSKEYIAGLRDSQSINITGYRLPGDAGQNLLRDHAGDSAPLLFRNTYSDGEVLDYTATCKKFGRTGGVDAVNTFTCSIRGTGTGTWSNTP